MTEVSEFDAYDSRILAELQADARITMAELGRRVHLSQPAVAERVRKLEAQGVIKGYHARVNPAALGKNLLVFVEITLAQKSEHIFKKVRDELQNMPEVLECHLISGSFDYLVKVRLTDMSEYRHLLGSILQHMPVPAQSNSYVVMEEVKESFVIPVQRGKV